MKILQAAGLIFILLCGTAYAASEPSVTALMQITQAGGSLVLDLEKHSYTVTQLATLAASLKFQATLTLKMSSQPLNAAQCIQIAKARPGQVIFWF